MAGSDSLFSRLRTGLKRTRDKLSWSTGPAEKPDWDALEESLVLADVGIAATTEILERLRARPDATEASLKEELLAVLGDVPATEPKAGKPRVTLLVGINGVGKTTTVAKLAKQRSDAGTSVLLVAGDTFRAAAQEQLGTWAERIGVEVVEGDAGRDPASVVHDGIQAAVSRGFDEVLVDTAGRLHTKRPLMDELRKIERVAARVVPGAPHETLLVMDATVGSNGLSQAREFQAALTLTGIVLTKMDGTAKGGIVLAIARELGLPVRYVGVGESASDLLPFSNEAFVDALLDPGAGAREG